MGTKDSVAKSDQQRSRRSKRFDQVLDEDDFGFAAGDDEDLRMPEICAPIKCDDDGPDFSKMVKKTENAPVTSEKKKDLDIRKRFMIEKPKGANIPGNIVSPGSANSRGTASTDLSLNNPLAESLTGDQILRQQLVEQLLQSAKR